MITHPFSSFLAIFLCPIYIFMYPFIPTRASVSLSHSLSLLEPVHSVCLSDLPVFLRQILLPKSAYKVLKGANLVPFLFHTMQIAPTACSSSYMLLKKGFMALLKYCYLHSSDTTSYILINNDDDGGGDIEDDDDDSNN